MAAEKPGRYVVELSLLLVAWTFAAAPGKAGRCADLVRLTIPDVTVTSATDFASGQFTPPGSSNSLDTPGFCRVIAVAKPTADSVINFEVWIPSAAEWNRDFEGVGNGGYTGAIQYLGLAKALQRGFAAASTDTGQTGEDLTLAAGHPEKIVDWGYRAIHVMTESAKLIIRAYTGAFPRHSFFMGCSTGGHQALSEVQRFPTDYDGVVPSLANPNTQVDKGFRYARVAPLASLYPVR